MSPTRRFLLIAFGAYFGFAVLGIVLFGGPNYSKEYLAKYGAEHKRFVKLEKTPAFVAFKQRPKAHVSDEKLHEELEFVEEYEERPEFHAEQQRIRHYTLYFRWLNSVMFAGLIVRFARRPLLSFLDHASAEVRTRIETAEAARKTAADQRKAAEAESAKWAQTEDGIRRETENQVKQALVDIQKDLEQAKVDLAREMDERRQEDLREVAGTLKRELVGQAIETLTRRHRAEAGAARLTSDVDDFLRVLEQIS